MYVNNSVKSIISKPDSHAVSQADMSYVVSEYIWKVKGKKVQISLPDNKHPMWDRMPKKIFMHVIFKPQLAKLVRAYNYAKTYFKNNKDEI